MSTLNFTHSIIVSVTLLFSGVIFSKESDFKTNYIEGEKFPNTLLEGSAPVFSKALLPTQDSYKRGFNELLPFVTSAPYQGEAGSCLFMSHTGAVEWWYSKLNPGLSTKQKNLSERLFMNLSKDKVGSDQINNWRTDSIYRLNSFGHMYTNADFPFIKSYFVRKDGVRVKAEASNENATYGEAYNWVIEYKSVKAPAVKIPKLERRVLYKNDKQNQWAVGAAPKNSVELLKSALKEHKAPIVVIYNHVGFWHAALVVGYNDHATSDKCDFVENYDERMIKKADKFLEQSEKPENIEIKEKLIRKAANYKRRAKKVKQAYISNGGCSGKGVFYVRDSIYPNKNMPLYDYDPSKEGEEEHLNAKVILREYEWLERLSNHAYQIYRP